MKLLDGKKMSEKILADIKNKIKKNLTLAVILVGDNAVSEIFINQKRIACEKVGIGFKFFKFPAKISGKN